VPTHRSVHFDRFTRDARRVLQYAQEEAARFNHRSIGTIHLLLGLLRVEDGGAARVLTRHGVALPAVRAAAKEQLGASASDQPHEIGLEPDAKRTIEAAVDEARRLRTHEIATEHLLLGLLRQRDSGGVHLLTRLGADPDRLRADALRELDGEGT